MNFMEKFGETKLCGVLKVAGMQIAQARPEIMLITGAVSVLAGTIYACTKTEKAKKVIENAKNEIKVTHVSVLEEKSDTSKDEKQAKIERGKKYAKVYIHAAYELAKIYGISALFWFGGMSMIFGAHSDLRRMNRNLAADIFAGNQLFREYRERVAKAVGEETEKKIFMGTQEGIVNVLERNEETGEEKIVQKNADIFLSQPGSIYALNFNEETTDGFFYKDFAERTLDARIDTINRNIDIGIVRAMNGLDICRTLGFNENAFGDNDEVLSRLLRDGISGNARKVPNPEMRKLKVTKLRGYQQKWDPVREIMVYEPCLRLDFNFYPLEGKI